MIIFYNLHEDRILSDQHFLDANHIKRTAFDVLLLKILYLVQKETYIKYLSYCIFTGLKVIFFLALLIFYLLNKKDSKTKFKII